VHSIVSVAPTQLNVVYKSGSFCTKTLPTNRLAVAKASAKVIRPSSFANDTCSANVSYSEAHSSEVVREALRLMEEQDRLRAVKLDQLRQDIRDGLTSGDPTPWNPDEIKKEGRKQRAARAKVEP
jgi:putative addiction module CopG family antidote